MQIINVWTAENCVKTVLTLVLHAADDTFGLFQCLRRKNNTGVWTLRLFVQIASTLANDTHMHCHLANSISTSLGIETIEVPILINYV